MKEVVFPGKFTQLSGDGPHELPIPKGDQAIEYAVYSDCETWLYVHCDNIVIPLAHGVSFSGRALVCNAKWLVLRTAKKAAIVAVHVKTEERRLRDQNSGKPVATHVPAPPALDVLAMARRLVGQREDRQLPDVLSPEDIEELFPADVDTEFGPGFVQLEEDEDIVDAVQAERERRAAEAAVQNKPDKGSGGEEDGPRRKRGAPDRGEPQKSGDAPQSED